MNRKKIVPIFIFFLFVFLSKSAFSIENELVELKNLFGESINLDKGLEKRTASISPEIGKINDDFAACSERIEFLKKEIISEISASLEKDDLSVIRKYSEFTASLSESDPSKKQFIPLSMSIRSKLIFLSLNKENEKKSQIESILRSWDTPDSILAQKSVSKSEKKLNKNKVPIYISFHWHMHQPIYWPYEDIITTQNKGVYSFNLFDVFYSRSGPYTSWPFDAVKSLDDAALSDAGAQVSFSGSLIENLNSLSGIGSFKNWSSFYHQGRLLKTARGNPRLDMVAFGYHHPLMALIGYEDIRRQISAHKEIVQKTFGNEIPYSKGIFPPENAFAEWMIPALVDEGIEWVMVDNIHLNRACKNYPWVKGENLYPPNGSDQVNSNPGDWLQLNGLWAPSKVSAWAERPHFLEYIDPATGKALITKEGKNARIIGVPTERYLGNEDGRGGFGALNYEMVMSQFENENNDPKHPILLVLHHDGDNYGGGTDSYYHANFYRFIEWLKSNGDRFVCTTIQDYLDQFPPEKNDVIHVEPGSWAGADNGDPEFLKWNGDPKPETGYSPDRNSWGVMTACRNILQTAKDQNVDKNLLKAAERFMMVSQTSCYEYWDGTEMWDSHPARACNEAENILLPQISSKVKDTTVPAIYLPQREPYNPGGFEWGNQPEKSDFTVWTYAYDFGGLKDVSLNVRFHPGKKNSDLSCKIFGGENWEKIPMSGKDIPAKTNPLPVLKAQEFSAEVKGKKDGIVDYYVSATDQAGNVANSPIMNVYVGNNNNPGGSDLSWDPTSPDNDATVKFISGKSGKLHWGINNWILPPTVLWPSETQIWGDSKAVESPMIKTSSGTFECEFGPLKKSSFPIKEIDAVMHYDDNTWGKDVKIPIIQ
ncbi:MAG: hypothetical protein HQM08_29670 [Candidatus Riflebacteria bacterium]|nr:hypothetical protein [Candidatus Riflebacteria bacterium]